MDKCLYHAYLFLVPGSHYSIFGFGVLSYMFVSKYKTEKLSDNKDFKSVEDYIESIRKTILEASIP